jgi:AhpD family alkylhydroperoxidase
MTSLKAVGQGGLSPESQEIVGLRAGEVNGCGGYVRAPTQNLVKAGESGERIAAVAAWR